MTLRVGLVGAGPWATVFHAPMLAAGPATMLAGVWSRRADAAEELAVRHGARAVATYDELLGGCDAVAFAVPPDVQANLAPRAAAAGRHLLLEKPLAFALEDAERLAEAVEAAGVRTLLVLPNRFSAGWRRFVEEVGNKQAYGAQASLVAGGSVPGELFATPWRVARGALLDLGPHVLDLMETALGPVVKVTAHGDPRRLLTLLTRHESGALGQAALSITTPHARGPLLCRVFTDGGTVVFDSDAADGDAAVPAAIAEQFADTITSGRPHPVDVRRGLALQRLIDQAERSLEENR